MRPFATRRIALAVTLNLALAGASPLAAQKSPPAAGPEQAYIDYLKAVHGDTLTELEPFLGPQALAQLKALPEVGRRNAMWGLRMPGLYEPPRVAKVEANGERILLQLATSVGETRTFEGAPGTPVAVSGRVEMTRRDRGWTIDSELWRSTDGTTYWAGLIAPGVFAGELVKADPVRWATDEIRTVISAEAAYQSANMGYYDLLSCLAQPAPCLSDDGQKFIGSDLASLETRYGFRRRFDPGPQAPAEDVGPGRASRSSLLSYAYWIIPDPAVPGLRARCGDASGRICETPDASAPATNGECPAQRGCGPVP